MSEQDTAEFPLPADTTDEERAQAKREIGKHAKIVGEEPRLIRLTGKLLGQTGPNWHFQYTRIYALPKGFLAAGHDIREGIKVSYADELEHVADGFENDGVREFIIDELRFRKLLNAEPARSH
ncbi:MAG TPA: hypothetical protein VIN70_02660 [Candidatus Limnocylindria bacterium]|jgi:hypothetical protein